MPTTPTDILTRLRAANPAPVSPERAGEPTAQATLKRILDDAAPDPTTGSQQRSHGQRRRWLRVTPVLASTLVALAVVGGALVLLRGGHGPASGTQPPGGGIRALIAHTPQRQLQRELGYVFAATRGADSSKACRWQLPSRVTYIQGAPGSDLISILGVLRRPPAPADRFNLGRVQRIRDVYRQYIRRAFSAGGVSYYIVPARGYSNANIPSNRCVGLEAAALNRYLPRIPAALRQPTREIGVAYIAYLRSLASEADQDTICLVEPGNGGGGSCGFAAKGIEAGFATDNLLGTPVGTFSGVVPDGVTTVTVVLPAIGREPAHAVTTRVEGNVYAVHASGLSHSYVSPTTVIWRSPGGRVLKRMSTSAAATRAYICKQSAIECLLVQALDSSSTSSGASPVRSAPARTPGR